ncbi:MAG: ABC transporter ATP-binding protein, partial [Clostridia bacterium]|nr:ABC transporter ATP-binding protein [Clostridia bacterium]
MDIRKGEFVVFVGPSGCGKSTTLRMIAGLENISSGELLIDGVRANEKTPKQRGIAMVFQSYALYPQMTVYDNIGFGLNLQGVDESEIERRVND